MQSELRQYGIDWDGRIGDFFDVYFGEGMRSLWQEPASRILWEGKDVDMQAILRRQKHFQAESLFFIPAQRVLTLRDGWPRPFTDYSAGDPFVVRHFSESLRLLMEQFGTERNVFPQERQLKREFQDLLNRAVFGDFALKVDKHLSQKRLMLGRDDGNGALPFMVWSAGQREFMPLLLSFYWLMPPTKVARRQDLQWVVIEEPEMGLHTQAISAVLLITLELLRRGYKVCISTHSPYVLDVVWALNTLKKHGADKELVLDIFDMPKGTQVDAVAESSLRKDIKVYYFDRGTGQAKDISGLDPGAAEPSEAGWGGLSEFSGRVADVVAKAVARGE